MISSWGNSIIWELLEMQNLSQALRSIEWDLLNQKLWGPKLCDLISPPGDSEAHSNLGTPTLETNSHKNTMKFKKSTPNPQVWVFTWEVGFVGCLISQRALDITLAKKYFFLCNLLFLQP